MSFIITLYTKEGIVMASDSRLTLNVKQQLTDGTSSILSTAMSDSNFKTLLIKNRIGISYFGQADIAGNPIGGYIQDFLSKYLADEGIVLSTLVEEINKHFQSFNPIPQVGFHIASFEKENEQFKPRVYRILPAINLLQLVNFDNTTEIQGAVWDGETDILVRLIQPLFVKDEVGNFTQLPPSSIPWQFFTLQDAIDFAVFAIQTTIDCVRFFPRPKTVGGPIDILVIRRDGVKWISKKELKVSGRQFC